MIRAFVSALQYRRRPRPVKTSTRDAAGIISTSSPDIISTLSLAKRSGRQNPRSGQPTKGGGKAPLTIEGSQRRVDVLEFFALAKAMGADPVELFRAVADKLPEKVDI